MTASKQILLYKANAGLLQKDIAALRQAGIVCLKVDSFDDVKVIDPYTAFTGHDVWAAAMQAIAGANSNEGPRTLFGRLLSERLAGCAPAKVEAPKK